MGTTLYDIWYMIYDPIILWYDPNIDIPVSYHETL